MNYYYKYKKYKKKYGGAKQVRFDPASIQHKEDSIDCIRATWENKEILPWERYLFINCHNLTQPNGIFAPNPANMLPSAQGRPCFNKEQNIYLHYDNGRYCCKPYPPTLDDVGSFIYDVLLPNIPLLEQVINRNHPIHFLVKESQY